VLQHLDLVPWADLEHAYGSAHDVPDLLPKLLDLDLAVFERAAAPDECWLLCAKAFAETDPQRAIAAYRRAIAINPALAHRVNPTWRLADLLEENGPR
jgi:hypothetical protein